MDTIIIDSLCMTFYILLVVFSLYMVLTMKYICQIINCRGNYSSNYVLPNHGPGLVPRYTWSGWKLLGQLRTFSVWYRLTKNDEWSMYEI